MNKSRRIQRILPGLLAAVLLLCLFPPEAVSAAATMSIKVYSGNKEVGSTRVYTATVTMESGPTSTPTPTPVPLPLMQNEGVDYTILKPGASDVIPEGFAAATVKFKNVDIPALQKTIGEAADASVMTIILLTADAKTSYFVYDIESQTSYPYVTITSDVPDFQIMDKSEALAVPDGYEAFDFIYLENAVTAYRLISDASNLQVLLYLMDDSGVSAFYYYDTLNNQILLYRGAVTIAVPTPSPTATQAPAETPAPTNAPALTRETVPVAEAGSASPAVPSTLTFGSLLDYKNPVVIIIYLLVLFCLVLLGICIVMIAGKDKPDKTIEKPDEEEDEPENYQQSIITVSDSPFVAPQPKVFFNEFGQGQQDSELYFGDKPPQAEVKLDFPDISRRTSPIQSVEHVPVRLQKALDAEKTKNSTDAGPGLSAGNKDNSNDPDFDPDDL